MNQCDCCDLRSAGMAICRCDSCFCQNCMLCSQHCQCLGANPMFFVDNGFEELQGQPAPKGLVFEDEEYPDADQPRVVNG